MRLPPFRKESLWSGAFCAAMLGVFCLGVYLPRTNQASALAEQLRMQHAVLARLSLEAARTKDVEREIADVEQRTSVLDQKLWTARETPRLLDQLDDLADRSGVTVTSIQPGILEALVPPAASSTPAGAKTAESGPAAGSSGGGPRAPQPPAAAYQKFTVAIETKGTFSATVRFVEGLESLPRFLSLSEMRITLPPLNASDNPDDPVLVVNVTATSYTLPESGAGQ